MTSWMKRKGAIAARTGMLAGALIASAACGDGDEPTRTPDGGMQQPTVDSGVDMDSMVAMDVVVIPMDSSSQQEVQTDARLPDGALMDPDGSIRPDGGLCPAGFELVGDFCVDHDDCVPGGGATCSGATSYCVNRPGGYDCACALGKRLDGNGNCVNIDECAEGVANCTDCADIDGPGRFSCGNCPPGTLSGPNGTCVDIDECAFDNACEPTATCSNVEPANDTTPGFTCTCADGFTSDPENVTTCIDIDECEESNGTVCPTGATCVNTDGDHTCDCGVNAELTNAGGELACIDINECTIGTDTCDPRAPCMNASPSFACGDCPEGYTLANGLCQDVNECDNDTDGCAPGQPCLNVAGGFECRSNGCPPGTLLNGDVCDDVDECADAALNVCHESATCTNTTQPIKYTCSCDPGTAGIPVDQFSQTSGCVDTGDAVPTLTSGYRHTCAVVATSASGGPIKCWGSAANGATVPPTESDFVAVVNGMGFSCATRVDKTVSCWGDNWAGQAPRRQPGLYEQLAAGDRNACGILDDRTITCWGRNDKGQITPPAGFFRSIAAGSEHMCAIGVNRDIKCWGSNDGARATPPVLDNAMDESVNNRYEQISLGAEHGCALDSMGTIRCWGANAAGQTNVPIAEGPFAQVQAGGYFTCGLKADHTVVCWGAADNTAVSAAPDVMFAAIAAGSTHVCGVTLAGAYVCWGQAADGQAMPPAPPAM